jgi:hypothetical protein
MAIKPNCIAAVRAAAKEIGREGITDAEIKAIDDRMQSKMRELAGTDEKWQSYSRDMRVSLAAEAAIADIRADAVRKVHLADLQVLKTKATDQRLATLMSKFDKISHSEATVRDMENVHNDIVGLKQAAYSRLIDLMDAVKSGQGASAARRVAMLFFDAENPQMTRDLANEIFSNADGSTGNKVAQEGAKAWLQVIEELRTRFNSAGGDIGKLEYGYVPTPHSAARVRGNGTDAARDSWVSSILPKLNRERYVDETGAKLGDGDMLRMLRTVWDTIRSEGMSKREPGEFKGEGSRANSRGEQRQLHFKDADSYLEYLSEYGRGSMLDAMNGHLGGMARDIGLLENYGPNPNAQMRLQFEKAAAGDGGKLQRVGFGIGVFRTTPEGIWRTLNGTASTPASEGAATFFQHIRNIEGLKLAGTFLKAFPDVATLLQTVQYNRLSYWELFKNLKPGGEKAEFAKMHGLMADSATRELSRFAGENIRQTWSGRISNSQMKLTLLDKWTDWLTMAFGLTKMGAMGRMAGKEWGALNQWDRIHLERRGVTAEDWAVVRTAELEMRNGIPMLTPDSIIDTGHEQGHQIANKILGIIRDESDFAVIKSDLLTRAASTWNGTQAGTGLGEFARATMLFKSFPIAMVTRHWRRAFEAPKVTDGSAPMLTNRMSYIGALMLTSTIFGAISKQASEVAQGKDPINMFGPHAFKFWLQAFSLGGGAGFYGDLITRDSSQDRSAGDTISKIMGPVASDLADLVAVTKGNIDQALAGKKTHAAAEAVNLARSHIPYINVWYAKAAIDHAFMNSLQENLSPGYLSKMQARSEKEWGQGRWWGPVEPTPGRAPDIGKAVGQ